MSRFHSTPHVDRSLTFLFYFDPPNVRMSALYRDACFHFVVVDLVENRKRKQRITASEPVRRVSERRSLSLTDYSCIKTSIASRCRVSCQKKKERQVSREENTSARQATKTISSSAGHNREPLKAYIVRLFTSDLTEGKNHARWARPLPSCNIPGVLPASPCQRNLKAVVKTRVKIRRR